MERVKPPTKVVAVRGPDGDVLTLANLPPPGTRWVAYRKAEIVLAVRGGLISLEEACRRYSLTPEEFNAWQENFARYGVRGLRVTHGRRYRKQGKTIETPEKGET
jgi:hypothetical protein